MVLEDEISKGVSIKEGTWKKVLNSVHTICKDPRLTGFQFKFIHSFTMTKKDLFRFGKKSVNRTR